MAGRSPARFLAPLALVASALALYLVVDATRPDETESQQAQTVNEPATKSQKKKAAKKRARRRTYVVKGGDTPSGIAEKTGVPLARILALNPDLDPQTLTPGTTIKLRR